MIKIKKGLDIPITGKPAMRIDSGGAVQRVALLARDYPGLKPMMLVAEGERVKLGQPLFRDKKSAQVLYTSPGAGVVAAINRGERRAFISIVISLDGDDAVSFPTCAPEKITSIPRAVVEERLLTSGLWTALRSRPFSKVPVAGTHPAAIFVTAIDTNPLAADPAVVINGQKEFFSVGLSALRLLTDGVVHLCHAAGVSLPVPSGIQVTPFSGPHPAGLPGTHIHSLEAVSLERQVWQIGYQDVSAIGALFLAGRIMTERIVALAGPGVKNPRLLRTRLGADLKELTRGELAGGDNRLVSGSVLSGQQASGDTAFLGRYHNQVSVLAEGRERKFLDWLAPGLGRHSVKRLFASALLPQRELPLTTSLNGSLRAMVPVGSYEKVMPLDLQITWLLRSLLAADADMAVKLGCLELDDEDLALCSYVCPGKIDYGRYLRQMLARIEEEGV
jgi:Na+-transporting NADH:ubiquinone oxidoreductase subunit A